MSAVLGSTPDAPAPAPRKPRWRRRVVAGSVGVVLVGGLTAAGLGVRWYLHTGAQPAEALPAATLAYVAVDLDPSGKEKLAAKAVLDKLPISKSDDLGGVGDLRKEIVDKILQAGGCGSLSFDDDVEPWLGERAAVAMVKVDAGPQPVFVLQSSDDDAAEKGMQALAACGGSDFGGWDIRDGWIVWTEKKEYADEVVEAAEKGTLADDPAYQDLVDEAGGSGLVTGYVAKEELSAMVSRLAAGEGSLPPGLVKKMADRIPSVALTVRAEDDQVRADVVMSLPNAPATEPESIEPALADLPADSSAVLALRPGQGTAAKSIRSAFDAGFNSAAATPRQLGIMRKYAQRMLGAPIDQAFSDVFDSTLVAVLGKTATEDWGRSPEQLPLAARLIPAADKKEKVLGYFRAVSKRFPLGRWAGIADGSIVAGTSPKTRSSLLTGGGLTDSATFKSVVDLDSHTVSSLAYVDLNSGLVSAALYQGFAVEPEVLANLQKLSAAGLAGWVDGTTSHVELRIALD